MTPATPLGRRRGIFRGAGAPANEGQTGCSSVPPPRPSPTQTSAGSLCQPSVSPPNPAYPAGRRRTIVRRRRRRPGRLAGPGPGPPRPCSDLVLPAPPRLVRPRPPPGPFSGKVRRRPARFRENRPAFRRDTRRACESRRRPGTLRRPNYREQSPARPDPTTPVTTAHAWDPGQRPRREETRCRCADPLGQHKQNRRHPELK